jgi:hypothetical protein
VRRVCVHTIIMIVYYVCNALARDYGGCWEFLNKRKCLPFKNQLSNIFAFNLCNVPQLCCREDAPAFAHSFVTPQLKIQFFFFSLLRRQCVDVCSHPRSKFLPASHLSSSLKCFFFFHIHPLQLSDTHTNLSINLPSSSCAHSRTWL